MAISLLSTSCFVLYVGFCGSADRMALFPVRSKTSAMTCMTEDIGKSRAMSPFAELLNIKQTRIVLLPRDAL